MGRAAQRRHDNRKRYLIALAFRDSANFDYQWERRLDSWLKEIRLKAKDWKEEDTEREKRVFSILDEAMEILEACGPVIYKRYAEKTYNCLSDACCHHVSWAIDPRLYRLSNLANPHVGGRNKHR